MRFVHQPPDLGQVAGLQGVGRAHGALVLGHDMPAAAIDHRRQQVGVALELFRRHVAQRLDARQRRREQPDALLAVAPAQVVFAGGVCVVDHGVADDQPHARVDRHQPPLQAAAVDQQRMSGRAVAGDELVHDAAAHADELVLGLLAGERQPGRVDLQAGIAEQRIAGGHLDRRR